MSEITIGSSAKTTKAPLVKITLVGVEYNVRQTKAGVLFSLGRYRNAEADEAAQEKAMKSFFEWIEYTFDKSAEEVYDRLEDPTDALDIEHLRDLQQALVEYGARPNPTTSPSASRTSRKRGGATSKATQ